jgi:hypothetical protein
MTEVASTRDPARVGPALGEVSWAASMRPGEIQADGVSPAGIVFGCRCFCPRRRDWSDHCDDGAQLRQGMVSPKRPARQNLRLRKDPDPGRGVRVWSTSRLIWFGRWVLPMSAPVTAVAHTNSHGTFHYGPRLYCAYFQTPAVVERQD